MNRLLEWCRKSLNIHPFDLMKVRLRSQVLDVTARFKGRIDCLTQTWKKEGIRGLYRMRGLPSPIVGAMAENATPFWSYTELQNAIRVFSKQPASQGLSLDQFAVAGAGAGFVTSFVLTPIELVKCKMQVQMLMEFGVSLAQAAGAPSPASSSAALPHSFLSTPGSSLPHKLPGPIAVLTSVIRTYGFRGLWLGQTATMIRETGGGAAWFASKEAVATLLLKRRHVKDKKELHAWESAVSGACAGVAYNVALFPADTVKSAIQTEAELRPRAAGEPAPTFLSTFRAMYRAQGIQGLYGGCGITVARAVPSSAIIFLIYDGLSRRFG
ncbi:mitochondrial carrier [Laetiporus sulphureus 93-53]|uniref:Mitochondrial carrier n=1 Tax=Laetiporus sulphureus 93-53 TaxID=1314785 RepID=A0A165GIL2_9APHY|nr:mitochondrial carrier [Laetiporus sulphureus 93-53]KZT10397.1 mitochondrial carrier [Laetiporus sulphureus 93-53]